MARGDQIYVMRPFGGMQGVYEHHGIDCGDGTVIHYRKPDDAEATISRTTMANFSMGDRIHLKRYQTSFIADDVIRRAESRLGEQQYELFSNNCEHFATWCKTGNNESAQLRQFGFGFSGFTPSDTRRLVQQATQSTNPRQTLPLFNQALNNIAIARAPIQSRYDRAIAEMNTWHRVAQQALRQGKEDVAKAALKRKVDYKTQIPGLREQLEQLDALQRNLQNNLSTLQP
jgi:isochorismate synthase EntC